MLKSDGTCDTGCGSGYYLYNGACYNPCPANTYPGIVVTVNTCFDCNYATYLCWTCTSLIKCTNCLSIFYQDKKTMSCYATCPAYTYVVFFY